MGTWAGGTEEGLQAAVECGAMMTAALSCEDPPVALLVSCSLVGWEMVAVR